MIWFALASLMPVCALTLGFVLGGVWPALSLLYVSVIVALTDRFVPGTLPVREDARSLRAADRLSVGLAGAHFALLPGGLWALCHASWLGPGQSVMAALALGVFMGQLTHPNAHELIHRSRRGLRRLGAAIYVSLLFGHHVSAHLHVHHVAVASDADPNSAPRGMEFYRFWPRAWIGSFRQGLRAETRRRAGRGGVHPYVIWCGGALACLAVGYLIGGWRGVAIYAALAGYAQMQLLLADYVQHYGLRRRRRPDGRLEPAGPQHSWNARPWFSSAMMLNAPRHSDHHQNPGRKYPALRLNERVMPVLPYAMPVMGAIALWPPLWRRIMDPLVDRWTAGGRAAAESA